jgi:hypothetical protein
MDEKVQRRCAGLIGPRVLFVRSHKEGNVAGAAFPTPPIGGVALVLLQVLRFLAAV